MPALKLLHRLYSDEGSSWAKWVHKHADLSSLKGDLHGCHWEGIRSLLPLYRAITTVSLGNGKNTSFWHDVWNTEASMAEKFPDLLSHCTDTELSVRQAVHAGLEATLVPRLTLQAQEQLISVNEIMGNLSLTDTEDKRDSFFFKQKGLLNTALLCYT